MRIAGPTALFILVPGAALAHSPMPGIEGFYSGLAHPLTVPGAALALASLGIILGQHGAERFKQTWPAFALGMALGLALTYAVGPRFNPNSLLFVIATLTSLLVASAWTPPKSVARAIGFLTGGLVSIAASPDPGPLNSTIITVVGAVCGANFFILFLAGWIVYLRGKFDRPWIAIALRVVGSWIAAISALMLALNSVTHPGDGKLGYWWQVRTVNGDYAGRIAVVRFSYPAQRSFHSPSQALMAAINCLVCPLASVAREGLVTAPPSGSRNPSVLLLA